MNIAYRQEINNMKPYIPGKSIEDVQRELGLKKVIKLASNENPYGCSELVKNAIKTTLDSLAYYPDGNISNLRTSLAKHLNIKEEMLVFGAGSDEIIGLIGQVFLSSGDELLTSEQSFPRYDSTAHLMGANIVKTPLKDYTYDLQAMKKHISKNTKLIILANPNNPTGTYFTQSCLDDFLYNLPDSILVVLDEAYYEYADATDFPDSLSLLKKHKNLLILRTFSKAYGLASLRVGYGIGNSQVIELINRVRNPFNVNTLAQIAAIESLKDQSFLNKCVNLNKKVKEFMYSELEKRDIPFLPSQANFIMFDAKRPSNKLFEGFQKKGIIIRPAFGVDNWVRVTLGTMEEMVEFIKTLDKIY